MPLMLQSILVQRVLHVEKHTTESIIELQSILMNHELNYNAP